MFNGDNPRPEIPQSGDLLAPIHIQEILNAVADRQLNFQDEPPEVSIMLVLMHIGDRYAPVECVEGEWSGYKTDVPEYEGNIPKCPNGHPLFQEPGLALTWMKAI